MEKEFPITYARNADSLFKFPTPQFSWGSPVIACKNSMILFLHLRTFHNAFSSSFYKCITYQISLQFLVSFFFEMYFIKFAKIVPSLMTDLYKQSLKIK